MNDRCISKSKFKARALEYFREVEQTQNPLIITDRGKPVLRLVPYQKSQGEILESLRGAVLSYQEPEQPVGIGPGQDAIAGEARPLLSGFMTSHQQTTSLGMLRVAGLLSADSK